LPKVLSSYPLSPQRGERVRVRGGKKKLLATSIACLLGSQPFHKNHNSTIFLEHFYDTLVEKNIRGLLEYRGENTELTRQNI